MSKTTSDLFDLVADLKSKQKEISEVSRMTQYAIALNQCIQIAETNLIASREMDKLKSIHRSE